MHSHISKIAKGTLASSKEVRAGKVTIPNLAYALGVLMSHIIGLEKLCGNNTRLLIVFGLPFVPALVGLVLYFLYKHKIETHCDEIKAINTNLKDPGLTRRSLIRMKDVIPNENQRNLSEAYNNYTQEQDFCNIWKNKRLQLKIAVVLKIGQQLSGYTLVSKVSKNFLKFIHTKRLIDTFLIKKSYVFFLPKYLHKLESKKQNMQLF